MNEPRTDCPWTDAALARHLDGDVEWPGMAAEELAGHLRECEQCQRALRQGRRLDAALASSAGRTAWDEGDAATRLLDRAIDRAEREGLPVEVAPRHPVTLRLLAAGALVAAGFAAAWLWFGDTAVRLPAPVAGPDPVVAVAPQPPADGLIPLPDLPPGHRPRFSRPQRTPWEHPRTRAEVLALADFAADETLATRLWLRGGGFWHLAEGPAGWRTATGAAEELRLEATVHLLDAAHPESVRAYAALIATAADGPVLRAALDAGRGRSSVRRFLRQRVLHLEATGGELGADRDRYAVAAAARLGLPKLDRALRRLVVRRPELVDFAAEQVASVQPRRGRLGVLLGFWSDLRVRGALAQDETAARRLFGGQPLATTGALVAEATTTGHADRRERCLLALAVRGDPTARPALLALLAAPRTTDAHLAAFALSRLPTSALADLRSRAEHRDAWLLRAALCAAGLPAAERWLHALKLTPEEHTFLLAGGLTRVQFDIAISLFRKRLLTGD